MKDSTMRLSVVAAVAATLAGGVCHAAEAPSAPFWGQETDVVGVDGKPIGKLQVVEGPTGVLLTVSVRGLTPGWHGMHLHQTGRCEDAFKSAGGHINHAEAKKQHGFLAVGGPDFGDLPNLWVANDGTGQTQVFSKRVSLTGAGGRDPLLDADGSALIIHAAPDDQATQPIGGSGDRVACAVVPGPKPRS
jgi:Cu-Zn family superoxide dismutase